MSAKKIFRFVLGLLSVLLLLSACSTPQTPAAPSEPPSTTAAPTATPTIVSTATAIPTATETPVPTDTPMGPFPTGIFEPASPTSVKSPAKNQVLTFLEDGTYRQKGGALTVSGKYAVNGDKLTLTETKNSGACGDFPGTYTWSFDGQALTLKTVENNCPIANIFTVEGEWAKQP